MSAIMECVADQRRPRHTAGPRLFLVRDIYAAAGAAGFPLMHGANATELASMLDRAFRHAAARRLLIAPDAPAGTRRSWRRRLERDLVPIYRAAFGRSAASGGKFDCPASRWIKSLCSIGAQRALGWCPDLIFREIMALSDQTLSAFFCRAATRIRRAERARS